MQPSEKQIAAAMEVPVASPRITYVRRILTAALSLVEQPVDGEQLMKAAEAGWNACRRQVYLLSEDYVERTHALKGADSVEGNFYRGQYDVAKSFAKAFSAFEARDCDYFKQIDFSASPPTPVVDAAREGEPAGVKVAELPPELSGPMQWAMHDAYSYSKADTIAGRMIDVYEAVRATLSTDADGKEG